MKKRYVVDTVAIISYFHTMFGKLPRISPKALAVIDSAFNYADTAILIFPGIVFVEIFDKWFDNSSPRDAEWREKFRYEVLRRIQSAENMEIREVDDEVIEAFLNITRSMDQRDKLVVATAQVLRAPLITNDSEIHKLQTATRLLEGIID